VKFAETKGSGIRVIRELMEERNLSMPLLQSDRTGNSFLAMLLFHHFLSRKDLDWLGSFEHDGLTEDEMKAMISAREVEAIDNSTYRDINRGCDTLTASKHLRKLCDCGLLEKKGQGPSTYYIPTERALANWPPNPSGEDKSPELEGLPPELERLPPELRDLEPELLDRISGLGKRGKPEDVLQVVLDLLRWRALSLDQLSMLIDRSPDHIRKTYLNDLIAADFVGRSNPDAPTDPGQTYFAKPKKTKQ